METAELILVSECCLHYQIDVVFFDSLKNAGLIKVEVVEEEVYVPLAELSHLEKMVRLYYELEINVEGIQTISYLLQRMNAMQQQIVQLSNQLCQYEMQQDRFAS